MEADVSDLISARSSEAWPGTTLSSDITPLTGGFWASMYRLHLHGQPRDVPPDVVFRIAPDVAMGAKELAVQRTVADMGFSTPKVRLEQAGDEELGGTWSVMDFVAGTPPLGDLGGVSALSRAPRLFARLPVQLAQAMSALHALDPDPVSAAVEAASPAVAWRIEDLLAHFETGAQDLGRRDLLAAVGALADRRPHEQTTVICHGDLHPFNLLVHDDGDVTVIDWTAAIRAEPAYDVAYTSMLLANPPLDAPRPLGAVIRRIGARVARRFVARYQAAAPEHDLRALGFYRALHGTRFLLEAASLDAREGPGASGQPVGALIPAAASALSAATGAIITTPS